MFDNNFGNLDQFSKFFYQQLLIRRHHHHHHHFRLLKADKTQLIQ